MSTGIRSLLLGFALVFVSIDVASAQLDTIVVTAEKRTGYGVATGEETGVNEPPHLFLLKRADHVISCAQDGSVHGHAVEEIVAARPVGPAPWPSEP